MGMRYEADHDAFHSTTSDSVTPSEFVLVVHIVKPTPIAEIETRMSIKVLPIDSGVRISSVLSTKCKHVTRCMVGTSNKLVFSAVSLTSGRTAKVTVEAAKASRHGCNWCQQHEIEINSHADW